MMLYNFFLKVHFKRILKNKFLFTNKSKKMLDPMNSYGLINLTNKSDLYYKPKVVQTIEHTIYIILYMM